LAVGGCGTTWLSTWEEMNSWYSPSNPLPYMMVETWDDYEEGTEIETGISNCISDYDWTIQIQNTNTLNWSYQFTSSSGSLDTVDHYVLWYTLDQTNYYIQDPDISSSEAGCKQNGEIVTCAGINLSSYNWQNEPYTLFIQAAGKAGVTNHLSPSVPYTP
jgi:hypothetical protein